MLRIEAHRHPGVGRESHVLQHCEPGQRLVLGATVYSALTAVVHYVWLVPHCCDNRLSVDPQVYGRFELAEERHFDLIETGLHRY